MNVSTAPPNIGSPRSGSYTYPATKHTSITEQRAPREHNDGPSTPNIVIYGETGVGKSSIINLIAGQELAHTSNDAFRFTFQHQRHIVDLNGMSCAIWETTGLVRLDEGSEEAATALAENSLRLLIQDLANTGGIHLVVYCVRATRATLNLKALQRNYDLFYVSVCRKKVPVALVVTGLEHQQGDMEAWWPANQAVLRQHGMRFNAHACVTTLDAEHPVIQHRRLDSQRLLRELVVRYSRLPAWKIGPSYVSSIFPLFQTALRRMMVAGRTKKSATTRRATTGDIVSASNVSPSVSMLSPDIHFYGTHTQCVQREGWPYRVVIRGQACAVDAHPLGAARRANGRGSGGGVLVFYPSPESPLENAVIQPEGSRHASHRRTWSPD